MKSENVGDFEFSNLTENNPKIQLEKAGSRKKNKYHCHKGARTAVCGPL